MSISIPEVLRQTLATLNRHRRFFLTLTAIFFSMNAALDWLFYQLAVDSMPLTYLFALIGFVIYVKQAVMVHRAVILEEVNQWQWVYRWRKPDTEFFYVGIGLWLLVTLYTALCMAVLMLIMPKDINPVMMMNYMMILFFVLLLVAGALFSRICLILPSRAMGESMRMAQSIDLTRGHGFKLLIMIVLLPILFNVSLSLLLSENSLLYNILISFVGHMLVLLQISLLSHCYLALTQSTPEPPSSEVV